MLDSHTHSGHPLPWILASMFALGTALSHWGVDWGLAVQAVGATALLLKAANETSREARAWMERRAAAKSNNGPGPFPRLAQTTDED